MEIPDYQPYYLQTTEELRAEIARLGLNIPVEEDSRLNKTTDARSSDAWGAHAPSRAGFSALAESLRRAAPDGQPYRMDSDAELAGEGAGQSTRGRVRSPEFDASRSEGKESLGLSLLGQSLEVAGKKIANRFCAQPITSQDAEPDGAPGPLMRRRYRRYAEGGFGLIWMEAIDGPREPAGKRGRLRRETVAAYRLLLQELQSFGAVVLVQLTGVDLLETADLAAEAGFDGIDLQGPREQRAEGLAALRQRFPSLLRATRLHAFEAVRGGFGVCPSDFRKVDETEPVRLVQEWQGSGLQLLNVTCASPILRGSERGRRALADSDPPDEHPLMTLQRQLVLARALRAAAPGLPVVGSGFGWLRQFAPQVAAGALRAGWIDFAGFGRGALAQPELPRLVLGGDVARPGTGCMVCFACARLQAEREPVGCVLRDPETFGPIYRQMRRFDADTLAAGAARCHLCEAAPCVQASPPRTPIPAFIQAFREGDERRAFGIIRERDVLPELTARTAPAWLESEGACIETTLTGVSVPIGDLQYHLAWQARERGETGVRLPEQGTGRRVAVVGGGPAGIAATARLLELGHTVHLLEKSDALGGVPALYLAARGLPGPREEIAALLQPALTAGRLEVQLGKAAHGSDLLPRYDAVLLTTGQGRERSLGSAAGVLSALTFLREPCSLPARVALLAGSDAAMDAARLVLQSPAELFLIFGGTRAELHWHGPESWWALPRFHALMECEPLGYETGPEGALSGVRLRHHWGESVLPVELALEALSLEAEETPPQPRLWQAGGLRNGGASVGHCVADALAVAEAMHQELRG